MHNGLVMHAVKNAKHSIHNCFTLYLTTGNITFTATEIEPRPVSGKIVFFSGFWMGMILLTCYSAILVSILTTRQPQLPFKDFQGLLEQPDWNLGVRTNTALADSLAVSLQTQMIINLTPPIIFGRSG